MTIVTCLAAARKAPKLRFASLGRLIVMLRFPVSAASGLMLHFATNWQMFFCADA
jgi:hypothetical protein